MHPILFQIGDFAVRSWGVMVSLGLLMGTIVALRLARREGIKDDLIYDFVIYVAIAGVLGARVWEVLFSLSDYIDDPVSALKFWAGGLSIQGAVAGGLLFTIWYIRRHKIDFWKFADILAPGLILGQAIGRVGCLLNGDAYGIPTNSWFGVVYAPGTPAYEHFGAVPLVPAELMEGIGDLLIFGILIFLYKRRPYKGFIALMYFVLYSVLRFTLEFWRSDSLLIEGTLKAAQVSSIIIALIAAGVAVVMYRKRSEKSGVRSQESE